MRTDDAVCGLRQRSLCMKCKTNRVFLNTNSVNFIHNSYTKTFFVKSYGTSVFMAVNPMRSIGSLSHSVMGQTWDKMGQDRDYTRSGKRNDPAGFGYRPPDLSPPRLPWPGWRIVPCARNISNGGKIPVEPKNDGLMKGITTFLDLRPAAFYTDYLGFFTPLTLWHTICSRRVRPFAEATVLTATFIRFLNWKLRV